jgi:hypothetical protein
MPILDVSEAFDPTFWDVITVMRRRQVVNQFGRAQWVRTCFSMQAVVVSASPNDLQRVPNYQQQGKAISIYSISPRLQGPAVNTATGQQFQPDMIIWHGSTFVVRLLEDYSAYGQGFVHTIAESIIAVDPPPFSVIQGSA